MRGLHTPRVVQRSVPWRIVALAFAVPLLFAAFTQHAWEDYFITLRSARNLVEGHGLVFTPGERLHTFTSPLGVLVPALCTAIAGVQHETAALWLFRLINAAALAVSASLLWRRANTLRLGGLGRFVLFGLVLTDAKLMDFSINGMETALLVLFTVLLWSELEAPAGPRAVPLGIALAGLMWTRPDAFVLGGALLVAHLLFRKSNPSEEAGGRPKRLLVAVGIGALLYLPWLLFAWFYYGTPIPHTIVAKGEYTPHPSLLNLIAIPWHTLRGQSLLTDTFMPTYWSFGGWPNELRIIAQILVVIAAFGWIVPRWNSAGRRASFALFVGMFYLCSIILFPWYVPPWTLLAAVALAFVADSLQAKLSRWNWAAGAWRVAWVTVVFVQVCVLAASAWQMRIHERLVETAVRKDIGEWLHHNAGPHDTVFLEPLGYIGYYSGLKMYDFPGLSSTEVVNVIRHGGRRYVDIISQLKPTWVILRPAEANRREFSDSPVLQHDYRFVRSWNALPRLNQVRYLPGREWVEWESCYLLFRRKDDAAPPRPES